MIELLAPAGNLSILKAAVDCGADAVYCGLGAFNARINANNFTLEEFTEGASYCHLRGSRIYLTLNTLVGDSEIDMSLDTARSAYEAGCDGILVQDVGLAKLIHSTYPEIPLHCSTQMNIYSDDFKALSDLGITRVVLPRELSLQEITRRTQQAGRFGIETEVFCHGAVCVCYSGLCLFSAMNRSGSRSGNRGQCAQPCREEYELFDNGQLIRKGHLLSPKDRDVTSYIDGLINSGVSSLKIEGRMRDVNYVMSAVTSYRKLIDAYYEGTLNSDTISDVRDSLMVNFNRGGAYTSQFLSGRKENGFLSGEYPGKFGLKVGRIISSDSKKGTVTFSFSKTKLIPEKGDYLSIRKNSREICSFPVGKVHEMPGKLAVKGLHPDAMAKLDDQMDVFLMGHKTVVDKESIRKTPVTISMDVRSDRIILDALVDSGINQNAFAECEIDLPADFDGRPLSSNRIREQLTKLGNTPFTATAVYFTGDPEVKCPVSLINELRRDLTDSLEYEITSSYQRVLMAEQAPIEERHSGESVSTVLNMNTYPCVKDDLSVITSGADIYAFSIYDLGIKAVRQEIIRIMNELNRDMCMILPDLCHDKTYDMALTIAKEIKEKLGDRFKYYMDSRIHGTDKALSSLGLTHMLSSGANIYNTNTLKYAASNAGALYLSNELSEFEISDLVGRASPECPVILHSEGLIPWMQSDFCPVGGNEIRCGRCFSGNRYTMKSSNMDDEVVIIPRAYECSSAIYGRAKNPVSSEMAESLADSGHSLIINRTII
ncbi:MAG: U32 family peptidase [Clostridiales bacterium]|nr:U32 family peptidase [Clostridiales bacterium]